jgi:hypothetical protein
VRFVEQTFLKPYFGHGEADVKCHFRPVTQGNIFLVRGGGRSVEFQVTTQRATQGKKLQNQTHFRLPYP